MWLTRIVEDVVRNDGARVLAGLIRLAGDFETAEDALQESYARALVAWPRDGIPDKPAAWLNTVSRRIVLDRLRREKRSTELPEDLAIPPEELFEDESGIEDDRLRLLFTCCHPALSPEARRGLALRTLGGLSTREIARAFVEPEATTAQRLVRAKRKIREARIPYEVPSHEKLPERVATVLSVLYLIFNEGYASTDAPSLLRPDLVVEAIRLARLTLELLPNEVEAKGLLALMLLTDSRRVARMSTDGEMVSLEEQDRGLWNRTLIDEGVRLIDEVLALRNPGPYQIQAAIAALHAQATTPAETDWRQIAALYETLLRWTPTPIVELNAAVALGMATSPDRALEWIARIEQSDALSRYHLLPASKADLLRRLGRWEEAAACYREAIALATNPAERRYLEKRLATGETPHPR
ncbi:MAG TPA: RNA polymerase sigma factor [Thermoanaerobaculia bacterium]|jgi:RNA polymerase sigma-70 factor (ECF subfamily)|nr:RNA polymerase sigma factor [Thermoanaerobaculia bacterium]